MHREYFKHKQDDMFNHTPMAIPKAFIESNKLIKNCNKCGTSHKIYQCPAMVKNVELVKSSTVFLLSVKVKLSSHII